ncbi:permease-like cell division protein FtsX [Candidatus Gracilibacteria bacterium]|nr:permease-like cell division protein FtsX [Candidatus Gracilibacteria bacterium]
MKEKINLNPSLKEEFQKGFSLFKENVFLHKEKIFFLSVLLIFVFFIQNIFFSFFIFGKNSVDFLEKKSDLIIEINKGVSGFELKGLKKQIKNFDGVEKVVFSSPENELKIFGEKHPEIKKFLERKNLKNPLPGYLEVYSRNIFSTKKILEFLKQEKFSYFINQKNIILNEELNQRIDKIADFVGFISVFFAILFGLLFIFLVFILFSILHISVYSHREEIKKEKFGGERDFAIKLPYFIEAVFFSVSAFFVSFLLFFGFLFGIKSFFGSTEFLQNFSKILGLNFLQDFGFYGVFMIFLIFLVSVISVDWNINRFLKK